uniref:Uncharacterized protein n=1 Tax=Megaselia scalaris TaxID=36166 RepID=T1GBK6_MEGSC
MFYNSLLGSFLTTYIRSPQISTLQQFKENNRKILYHGVYINTTFGFKDIKDILFPVKPHETFKILNSNDNAYGYIISSIKPFDRYIDLVQELGLYEFWKEGVNFESFNISDKNILFRLKKLRKISEDNGRILNINYFIYPLCFLCLYH